MNRDEAVNADGGPDDHRRAEAPSVRKVVGRTPTSLGDVLVLLTDNPLPSQPNFHTYVALADWMPDGFPVVMFVVVRKFRSRDEVGMVYASRTVRGYSMAPAGSRSSVAVQIGCWLFREGAFTHHSNDRTPGGDRWARQVGGTIPPLLDANDCRSAAPAEVERKAELAYIELCGKDWTPWLKAKQ